MQIGQKFTELQALEGRKYAIAETMQDHNGFHVRGGWEQERVAISCEQMGMPPVRSYRL